MAANTKLVVVGASIGGLRAVEAARIHGHTGPITMIGDEPHFPPYDRPPMSKQMLEPTADLEQFRLSYMGGEAIYVDLRLGVSAIGLDTEKKCVRLSDGDEEPYDKLIIATGSRARTLPAQPHLARVFTVRTLGDSMALRDALRRRPKVAIVGGGFIGCEVASVATAQGCEVTIIHEGDVPLQRSCDRAAGAYVQALHASHGVEFVGGDRVETLVGSKQVEAVQLSDGRTVEAEVVIIGIGSEPNTEWLDGSGLVVDNGVRCGADLLAQGCEDIAAVGDVAHWFNPMYGRSMRVEHWSNAVEQGFVAAPNLLNGTKTEFSTIPYVWSDQYGLKVQIMGVAEGTYHVVAQEEGALAQHVGLYEVSGSVVGAITVNRPDLLAKLRRALTAGADLDKVRMTVPRR